MEGAPAARALSFLMVDMVGSTRSWEDDPNPTADAIVTFRDIWWPQVQRPHCVDHTDLGDGLFAVFDDAATAVDAALSIQEAVDRRPWSTVAPSFRMGIYTGTPHSIVDGNYGRPANRCQRLMEVGHGGQVLAAASTVAELPSSVPRRYLGRHRLRDLRHDEPVYQLSDGEFPPILSLDAGLRRLPRLRTATVGRVDDIRAVTALIAEKPLITLIGPGGVGKTRLALEAAAEASLSYAKHLLADGLHFCDLGPVIEPATLLDVVARSLEVPRRRDQQLVDGIVAQLRDRRLLVVLDNCEHVLDAAAELVSTLLQESRGTIVLATSRAPLGVPGEHVYRVPPMSLPPSSADPAAIEANESVRLFVARALDANPDLVLDEEAVTAVGQICRHCDGLPLAIELVASRCRSLSPGDIVDALAIEPLTLPTRPLTAFERQRTIENTIAWSYDLLDPKARVLLDAASVFAPDFDVVALGAVAEPWVPAASTRRLVSSLVDMSMVDSHAALGGARLRLLETIRGFAAARLELSGRGTEVTTRHIEHYARVADEAALGMWTADEDSWRRRFAVELPNLQVAAMAALATEHWDAALSIPVAMRNFAHYGGHYEVFTWVEVAARAARDTGHPLLPEALGCAAFGRWLHNDLEGARTLCEEAMAIEDQAGLAPNRQVRMTLMATALYSGDIPSASKWGREMVAISDAGGVTWLRSMARSTSSIIEFFNDPAYARVLAREGLRLADELGNPSARCHALFGIGVTNADDNPEAAADALVECVELSDRVGNQWTGGMSRIGLLRAQSVLGDRPRVLVSAADLLRHWLDVGDWAQVWTTLQVVAGELAVLGRDADALTVEGALVRIGMGSGFYQDPLSQQHAAAVAAAATRLTAEDAAAARLRGGWLSERQIVEYVLEVIDAERCAVAN